MHIDGVFVQQHGHGVAVHFADDPVTGRVSDVNDDEVLAGGRAQGNFAGGEILRHPVVPPVHMAQDVLLLQEAQQFLRGGGVAEGVAVLKGQLIGGALEVAEEDVQVVRIEQGVFRGLMQEVVRVADDILVDGRRGRHKEYDAGALAPSRAPRLLPRAGNGAGISAQNAGIQRADVDAQFKGVGGHHRVNLPGAEAALDFPSLGGQVSAPVAPHASRVAQGVAHQILQVFRQHLHRQPGAGKGDGLDAVFQQHARNLPGFGNHAPADAQLAVDHRRVVEHKMPLAHGRAVVIDEGHVPAGEGFRQFLRVGDGGGAEDELRMTAVELAQTHQAAQHIGQVGAEHAAVGVDFVDDNIFQVFKQFDPFGVVG